MVEKVGDRSAVPFLSSREGERPLFVTGCQRSGTTAFTKYLNKHPEVLLGMERYGRVPAATVTPELFGFERILDYGKEDSIMPREYYLELLSRKDPARLRWIGDKYPGYLRWIHLLSENNLGAHFIVLYRPVEEVAESWEARSKNPGDPWLGGKNGFELGVKTWNNMQAKTRGYIEAGLGSRILVLSYHDFFYRNERCVPLISRFLGIEIDGATRERWGELTARFESERRPKEPLTEEQLEFVRENKDRAAEEWILGRLENQWRALEACERESKRLVRDMGDEPRRLADNLLKVRAEAEEETRRAERLSKQNRRLKRQVRDLRRRLQGDGHPEAYAGLLEGLKRLGSKVFGR
jgi:hypothetical protein